MQKSKAYWVRAEESIFSLVQLYEEGSGSHIRGNYPRFIRRGRHGHIWDVDGNEYVDYDMGLGPIILGYCYEAVDRAVMDQLRLGTHFSLVSPGEVEYAELVIEHIPCAGKVRFLKTGSSAAEAAVRIARAYTGRNHVIRGMYHGWHEWTAAGEGYRQGGILPESRQYLHRCGYNDLRCFEKMFESCKGGIAAVIIEPVIIQEPLDNFLSNLLALCHAEGALLIFDEVVTGFRFDIGGAQRYFGITPDLAAFGKAAANGLPLSFVAGRKEIMDAVDKDVYLFTTFGGERLSLAAGMAVINELKHRDVTGRIWRLGGRLKKETNAMAGRLGLDISLEGYPPRLMLAFKGSDAKYRGKMKYIFMQECVKRGVFIGWTIFPCYTHTDADIDYTLNVFEEAMKVCRRYTGSVSAWVGSRR